MTPELEAFIQASGLAPAGAVLTWTALTGGVSSDIWLVELPGGRNICVKRALAKLKVAADWHAPVSRNAFEWHWMQFADGVLPGVVPKPLAHDPQAGVFAMEFLPAQDFPLWKAQLLAGEVDTGFAALVGTRLGRLHAASAHRKDLARAFDTTESFYAIRLEPYLLATARCHPALALRLEGLVASTAKTRIALVHGDVSPKNILVGPHGPVLLDAECAWYGDPAFDLAFCLNHLLLKAVVSPRSRGRLQEAFCALVSAYFEEASAIEARADLESRAAALLPALLLARVDGKSPVEYITEDSVRERVRHAAMPLVHTPLRHLQAIAEFAYPRLVGGEPDPERKP